MCFSGSQSRGRLKDENDICCDYNSSSTRTGIFMLFLQVGREKNQFGRNNRETTALDSPTKACNLLDQGWVNNMGVFHLS